MVKGLLIAIEGPDMSGKTTLSNYIMTILEESYKFVPIKKISYPNINFDISNTHFNKSTYNLIGDFKHGNYRFNTFEQNQMQYLFALNRVNEIGEIKKLLNNNYIVISDRYSLSNLVYAYAFNEYNSNSDGYIPDYLNSVFFKSLQHMSDMQVPDITIFCNNDYSDMLNNASEIDKMDNIDKNTELQNIILQTYKKMIHNSKIYKSPLIFYNGNSSSVLNLIPHIIKKYNYDQ